MLKTSGREPTCDLVVDHPSVSRVHAKVSLGDNGLLTVEDANSHNGTYLQRNETWIRVAKVKLCIGDRIRFGEREVPLEKLTGLFQHRAGVKLGPRHFSPRRPSGSTRPLSATLPAEESMQKPRRNPVTGKIEEDQP